MNRNDSRRIALVAKGFANPHRVNILLMLEKENSLTLGELTDRLRVNFRTASEHTKKLANSGLVAKSYYGNTVQHSLTPLGESVLRFIRSL